MGVRIPLSVEVISSALLEHPAGELARALYAGTRRVMSAARA
jgi:hypothetical protein